MTETQLHEIEAELRMTLPELYRATVLSPPFRPILSDWIYWLYDDPARIIETSKFPHSNGEPELTNWRETYLVFGQTASGDLYFLDTTQDNSPIYCLSHEDSSIVEEYPDFDAYLQEWKQEAEQMLLMEPVYQEQFRRTQSGAWMALALIGGSVLLMLVMLTIALFQHFR